MQTEETGARVYAELACGKGAAGAQGTVCQVGACVRGNVSPAGEARWNRFGLFMRPVQQGAPSPFPKKQKVSPAKDNTLQKKSSSQELLDASHCYFVTDSLLLNGLEARGYRKKTLFYVATTMG